MTDHADASRANQANWDERATAHAARSGAGYRVQRYIDDRAALSDVVRFDRARLGDVAGLRAAHLQCHIGTDTLSLARLGARVTGLDFSSVAVAEARRLVAETADDVRFVQADVYDAVDALGQASYGPRLHGHRRALLAAERRPLGSRRRAPARPRRTALHSRGPPDPLVYG